jgi:hypothetical protein
MKIRIGATDGRRGRFSRRSIDSKNWVSIVAASRAFWLGNDATLASGSRPVGLAVLDVR